MPPSYTGGPWQGTPHPSPFSSPCARFLKDVQALGPATDNPLALAVLQAQAEVTSHDSSAFPALFASPSAEVVFAPTRGGYKYTSPYLSAYCPADSESLSKDLKGTHIKLGLADLAFHGAADDDSKLLFVGDPTRVKSYSWADGDRDPSSDHLLAVHTMNSIGFSGAIGVLPNGRVARSGVGKIAIWDYNNLPTHQNAKHGIIGKLIDLSYCDDREDVYDIEESSGSEPDTVLTLTSEPKLKLFRWHNHPSHAGTVLAASDPDIGPRNTYDAAADARCLALDIEHGGKAVIEYSSHRGRINAFSTSKGDPHVFTTAANDGYARVFDVRVQSPSVALRAGRGKECTAAVLCHPGGVPYIFTSDKSAECITLWDVRTKSPLYELATGNNSVEGMIWSESRNELWAATSYRGHGGREDAMNEDDEDDEEEPNEDDDFDDDDIEEEDDPAWPKNAAHTETYFGHIFDSGDDRVYRYAFKLEPNLEFVPSDGGAMADRNTRRCQEIERVLPRHLCYHGSDNAWRRRQVPWSRGDRIRYAARHSCDKLVLQVQGDTSIIEHDERAGTGVVSHILWPKPDDQVFISQLDNPWRASLSHQGSFYGAPKESFKSAGLGNITGTVEKDSPIIDPALLQQDECDYSRHPEYCWQRPGTINTPGLNPKQPNYDHDYERMLGYSCEFLATLLCPQRSMCHQRFELVVDDLVFIGHPVCSEEEEKGGGECNWRFKTEKAKLNSRGRDHTDRASTYDASHPPSQTQSLAASPEKMSALERSGSPSGTSAAWLNRFQLALVLDLPDPSSSASGNVSKYLDAIYEQIAFTFAAVLFQEQVLENFVEKECDALISLQESLFKKEEPYENYVNQALQISSIASAMKAVYEGIKARSMAYLSLNAIPLELQLPPYLDDLLRAQDDYDLDFIERPGDEEVQNWGPELSFGWKLPGLAPWKSLLLLDGESDIEDPLGSLRGANNSVNGEERAMAESLLRFLETASITLSLADMGNLLDWDLEAQVYPVVRWLVLHRRAKVVDTVNMGLKTIFALPAKLSAPLPKLAEEFRNQFSSEVPPLPRILAMISSSLAKQSDSHFFASVVKTKELIPIYHDIVVWMLKRDLLVTLHLRIRIIATRELKKRVTDARTAALANRAARMHQKKLARQEKELSLRGRDGRKPLHIPSSVGMQRRRSSNKSGGTSSLHGGHHSDIEEFDEFDERNEEEEGFAPSSSNKTPSGLTAFMSFSPPKARGSAAGSIISGSIAQRRGLVVPAPSSMSRRLSSTESRGTAISELVIREEEVDEGSSLAGRMHMFGEEEPPSANASSHSISAYRELDEVSYGYGYYDAGDGLLGGEMEPDEEEEQETDYGATDSSDEEDGSGATLINDPGRATPRQRRWLTAMSEGVDIHIAKRFEQINQYFDGKRSDDEILYRADITRRQLREVLHHYEPFLQTFLHPS